MKSNVKHIILVTSEFPPQPGGIGNHAFNLAEQLSLNGYSVSVLADQRSKEGNEEWKFDNNLNFEIHRTQIRRIRSIMYFERFFKLVKLLNSADIIIASGKFSLWNVGVCSLLFKKKYIAVIHGSEVNFQNQILKRSIDFSLKRFHHIIAVSNYTKSLIEYLNVSVNVIPNGYDSNKWDTEMILSEDLIGSPKLITVGNVTSRKGQKNVIKHLPILKASYPNIHYHCIGLPTEADDFKLMSKKLDVDAHVTFHGRVDDRNLQRMLLASDIFVMLSNETATGDVEGFGIAVIEANALGLPAIGSSGTGLQDAIDQNVTGYVIDVNDSEAFLLAINRLLKEYDTFSKASKKWAVKHQWKTIVRHYLEILKIN